MYRINIECIWPDILAPIAESGPPLIPALLVCSRSNSVFMASISSPSPPCPPEFNRRTMSAPETIHSKLSPSAESTSAGRYRRNDIVKEKEREERERREEVVLKIASKKAISVILRREATKAVIEKRGPNNSKKLLPRTVLEALHERITALRWDSALKVSSNFSFGSY